MNYSKIIFISLFILLSLVNTAQAENWVSTDAQDGSVMFVDLDSVKVNGNFVFYNIKNDGSDKIITTIQSDPENNFAGIVTQQTYADFYKQELPYLYVGHQKAKTMQTVNMDSPIYNANRLAIKYANQQKLSPQESYYNQYNKHTWRDSVNGVLNTINQTNATGQNIINTLRLFRY